jgi:hypothetical protein
MKVITARVMDGRIDVDAEIVDGPVVTVIAPDENGFDLTDEQEQELVNAFAEIETDHFVDGDELLAELRARRDARASVSELLTAPLVRSAKLNPGGPGIARLHRSRSPMISMKRSESFEARRTRERPIVIRAICDARIYDVFSWCEGPRIPLLQVSDDSVIEIAGLWHTSRRAPLRV